MRKKKTPLTEAEWRQVFELRCRNKRGEHLLPEDSRLCEWAMKADEARYKGMDADVFAATVPFGSGASLNYLLNNALRAWAALAGVRGDSCDCDCNLEDADLDYDLKKTLDDLNHSRELDPSGLTTCVMLRGLCDFLFRARTYTALDLLTDRGRVEGEVSTFKDLRDAVEDPRVVALVDDFAAGVKPRKPRL